jgi:hypothetical protein
MEIKFSRLGFKLPLATKLLLNLFGVKMPVVEGVAELPRGEPVQGFLELFEIFAAVSVGFDHLPNLKPCSSKDWPPSRGSVHKNDPWAAPHPERLLEEITDHSAQRALFPSGQPLELPLDPWGNGTLTRAAFVINALTLKIRNF